MTKRLQINRSVDSSLRARIAAVASGELCRQQHAIDPYRVWQWFDMNAVADAVIAELGLQAQHLDRASCVGNKPAIRYVTEWQPE